MKSLSVYNFYTLLKCSTITETQNNKEEKTKEDKLPTTFEYI